MSTRPDDIPQDVWDIAWKLQGNTEYDEAAVRGAAYPELLRACENDTAAIARAILAAKAEERQVCINVVMGFVQYSEQRGGTACNPYVDAQKIASALRYVNTAHKSETEA